MADVRSVPSSGPLSVDVLSPCARCARAFPMRELKRCGRCHISSYCSKECQRSHWRVHKLACDVVTVPGHPLAHLITAPQTASLLKSSLLLLFGTVSWCSVLMGLVLHSRPRLMVVWKSAEMPERADLIRLMRYQLARAFPVKTPSQRRALLALAPETPALCADRRCMIVSMFPDNTDIFDAAYAAVLNRMHDQAQQSMEEVAQPSFVAALRLAGELEAARRRYAGDDTAATGFNGDEFEADMTVAAEHLGERVVREQRYSPVDAATMEQPQSSLSLVINVDIDGCTWSDAFNVPFCAK